MTILNFFSWILSEMYKPIVEKITMDPRIAVSNPVIAESNKLKFGMSLKNVPNSFAH